MKTPRIRAAVLPLCLLTFLPATLALAADKKCELGRLMELPISFDDQRPTMPAKINGQDATFNIDSGAFWSMISASAAERYGLKVDHSIDNSVLINGVGGLTRAGVTWVKEFTLFGVPFKNVEFVVLANGLGGDGAGLIGQNVLRIADIEYDLSHGKMRLFRSKNCKDANLAYWLKPDEGSSVLELKAVDAESPHLIAPAYLNGEKIRAMFDSGAATSIVSLEAAKRAGLTPESAGVQAEGEANGVGRRTIQVWIGTFKSFRIGDEEIQNARLRFGKITLDTDMLLGQDYFLSHRIYVSHRMSRLYMSYAGGPVFDLRPGHSRVAATSVAPPSAAEEPTDAAGFASRASILAAREDNAHALADWSRAIELAPDNADYRMERATLQFNSGASDAALADLGKVLSLQPDNMDALLMRASILRRQHKEAEALADLDHAAKVASPSPEQALVLANQYLAADFPAEALPHFNRWIELHKDDARIPIVLNSRCWARALLGVELDQALKDCKAALKGRPDTSSILDSRGLVYLRMGELDKAIADYDAVLEHGDVAWSLYGRGIAKIRKGDSAGGQRDLAASKAIDANLAEKAAAHGIAP